MSRPTGRGKIAAKLAASANQNGQEMNGDRDEWNIVQNPQKGLQDEWTTTTGNTEKTNGDDSWGTGGFTGAWGTDASSAGQTTTNTSYPATSEPECRHCEGPHLSSECPERRNGSGGGGGGGGGGRGCFNCGSTDHIKRDCPQRMANPSASSKSKPFCFNCGAPTHDEEACPTRQGGNIREREDSSSNRVVSSSALTERGPQESRRAERSVGNSPNASSQSTVPLFRPPGTKKRVLKPTTHDQLEPLYNTGEESRNPVGENFERYQEDTVKVDPADYHQLKKESFDDFDLVPEILEKVKKKYEKPLPIQQYAWSIIASGKNLKASARTGCGKTAAFLLPVINSIVKGDIRVDKDVPQSPKVLIIAPTRELAQQIYTDAQSLAALTNVKIRLCHGSAFIDSENQKLMSGTNILIATLGRLVDHLNRKNIKLEDLRYLVFDEADRLLDDDFAESIEDLMRYIDETGQRPQTLLFSATFPERIMSKINPLLNDHVSLQVGILGTVSDDIEQTVLEVPEEQKKEKLLEIIKAEPDRSFKTFIFVRSKDRAEMLYEYLRRNKVLCVVMHADRDQLERNKALREFNDGKRNVMVATLVASRGLDVVSVNHVINYDLPNAIAQYVNCLGRTGRVGNRGKATSFFDAEHRDDRAIARDLLSKLREGAATEIPDFLNI